MWKHDMLEETTCPLINYWYSIIDIQTMKRFEDSIFALSVEAAEWRAGSWREEEFKPHGEK